MIVNDAFVRKYVSGTQAVGASFSWGEDKRRYLIVGVVKATKNLSIGEQDVPQLYQPLAQIENDRTRLQFVMRSQTPPVTQLGPVRDALRKIDPNVGVEVSTLYSSIGLAFLPSQIGAALLGTVGLLGLMLAAIGLHGIMAYSVLRRTRELGAAHRHRRDAGQHLPHGCARVGPADPDRLDHRCDGGASHRQAACHVLRTRPQPRGPRKLRGSAVGPWSDRPDRYGGPSSPGLCNRSGYVASI